MIDRFFRFDSSDSSGFRWMQSSTELGVVREWDIKTRRGASYRHDLRRQNSNLSMKF